MYLVDITKDSWDKYLKFLLIIPSIELAIIDSASAGVYIVKYYFYVEQYI